MISYLFLLDWLPMIKIPFVISPLWTSLLSHNNSILKKLRNFWVLESEIYGQIKVGGCDIQWLTIGLLLQWRSVESTQVKNWSQRSFDLSRTMKLKFDLPLPNKSLDRKS